MRSEFTPGLVVGVILTVLVTGFLNLWIGYPLRVEQGFKEGACTIVCKDLESKIEENRCYCKDTDGNKLLQTIPTYKEK